MHPNNANEDGEIYQLNAATNPFKPKGLSYPYPKEKLISILGVLGVFILFSTFHRTLCKQKGWTTLCGVWPGISLFAYVPHKVHWAYMNEYLDCLCILLRISLYQLSKPQLNMENTSGFSPPPPHTHTHVYHKAWQRAFINTFWLCKVMHVINNGDKVYLWNTYDPRTYVIHNRAMLISGLFIFQSSLKLELINHMTSRLEMI